MIEEKEIILEEREIIDAIIYRDDGFTEVRKAFLILKNGVEISRRYHRHVVDPDQEDLSGEDERVRAICHAMDAHRKVKAVEKKEKDRIVDEMLVKPDGV